MKNRFNLFSDPVTTPTPVPVIPPDDDDDNDDNVPDTIQPDPR